MSSRLAAVSAVVVSHAASCVSTRVDAAADPDFATYVTFDERTDELGRRGIAWDAVSGSGRGRRARVDGAVRRILASVPAR